MREAPENVNINSCVCCTSIHLRNGCVAHISFSHKQNGRLFYLQIILCHFTFGENNEKLKNV